MTHEFAEQVGLIGDTLTFVGGLILAFDAVNRAREFEKIRRISKVLASGIHRLIVEVEGKTVEEEADIEAVFLRRSARFAAVGFAFLAFGFVGILAYRIMEIYYVQ